MSKALVEIEESLFTLKGQFELLQSRFAEVLASRGQVEKLTAEMQVAKNEYEANYNKLRTAILRMDQFLSVAQRRAASTEQSLGALGKITTGLTKVLVSKGITTDEEIMDKVREFDDDNQKKQIEEFLSHNVISLTESADERSILIVRQENQTTGKLVSDYRAFDLTSLAADNDLLKAFVGKKAGDVFVYNSAADKESHQFTVKAVYTMVEAQEVAGEPQAAEPTEPKQNEGA